MKTKERAIPAGILFCITTFFASLAFLLQVILPIIERVFHIGIWFYNNFVYSLIYYVPMGLMLLSLSLYCLFFFKKRGFGIVCAVTVGIYTLLNIYDGIISPLFHMSMSFDNLLSLLSALFLNALLILLIVNIFAHSKIPAIIGTVILPLYFITDGYVTISWSIDLFRFFRDLGISFIINFFVVHLTFAILPIAILLLLWSLGARKKAVIKSEVTEESVIATAADPVLDYTVTEKTVLVADPAPAPKPAPQPAPKTATEFTPKPAPAPAPRPAPTPKPATPTVSLEEQLRRLREQYNSGIITEEEFKTIRERLLSKY